MKFTATLTVKLGTWSKTWTWGPLQQGYEIIKLAGVILGVGIDLSVLVGKTE